MPALLELDKVTIRFGGLTAVSELSLSIGSEDMFRLISPNGAGKTTAFNLITGVYQPTGGLIIFNGQCTAVQLHRSHGIRDALWRGRSFHDAEATVEKQVMDLLEIFNLSRFRQTDA